MYGNDIVYGAWGQLGADEAAGGGTAGGGAAGWNALANIGTGILQTVGVAISGDQQKKLADLQLKQAQEQAKAQQRLAEIAARSQMSAAEVEKKRAEADTLIAQFQAQAAAAQAAAAGVPWYVWAIGGVAVLGMAGGGIYLATRK